MVKGLNYSVNAFWFALYKNGQIAANNLFGNCSQGVKDNFDAYSKLEVYIPDDYLNGRFSEDTIKSYIKFLENCNLPISYEGISEDWGKQLDKLVPTHGVGTVNSYKTTYFTKQMGVIHNYKFHKFVINKKDYVNAVHLMAAFVSLRYLYATFFEGLVEDILKLERELPKLEKFKVLLMAHYSPNYIKEGALHFNQSKWGLIGLFAKYGTVSSGYKLEYYKAFKLIAFKKFITLSKQNRLNSACTENINTDIQDIKKLFVKQDYKKIIEILK